MFHRILAATGLSPWSCNAVDTAIRLAAHLQIELVIMHILEDDPEYQPQGSIVSDPRLRATHAQVAHRTVTQWGVIPEQIVRLAETDRCDLIVMGTRHLTGDKRLMTGRICNAVIATAPCPVLVMPFVQ